MAQKVTVQVIDDLDGAVITDGTGGTIGFTIEGKSYEIDLSGENTEKLYAALEPYIEKARSVHSAPRPRVRSSSSSSNSRDKLQDIREWAKAHGHDVATRGRISKEIQEAYARANG
ncbi:Lsr2 family protein [Herbiconiux sp. L3-i23]|uniref:histone-like nucleoid-structuring protein Lsr2 n=1 Tax=Herbiconiux sp. L3-i23 TaxID=2905871 RepID=UPI0020610F43|nr:Lsr2 family protein [Herbiconiux sp. L3-i23]BDI23803.1 Lsr2 family protein [Herbiconiux sp. L3-i23]